MTPSFAPARPLLAAALALLIGVAAAPAVQAQAAAAPATAAPAPTLRPEVSKPLAAAQEAIKAGNHQEALARLAEAEAMPGLTPYETYILRRLKAPALFAKGDLAPAMATFESVLGMADLPAADKPLIQATVAKLALQLKDYAKAATLIKAHLDGGGTDPDLQRVYPQVLALSGDHAGVLRLLGPVVAADETAGRATPENTLRLMAGSQDQTGDKAGYAKTVERLAATTNKLDYWRIVVGAVANAPGFADERQRLDLYRVRRAIGLPLQAPELADMAFRARQAGLPAEAQALMEEGYASGLLGKGPDAAADKELRDSAAKGAAQDKAGLADSEASAQKAKEGNALVNLGLAVSGTGAHDKALALMTAGIAKGGLRRPDEAALHLGVVQWRAGKTDEALKTFAGVQGSDGTAAIARVWTMFLKAPARQP